jgi:hypothetical protein
VSDGVSGGADMLNDTATVYITVTDTNEYNPIFTDGPMVQIHVLEGSAVQHVWQLNATDDDGNDVTYQLYDANETTFSVEPSTGWLNVLTPLIRVIQSQYLIQVTAIDNGVPSRQTMTDVIVIVDPATSVISMFTEISTISTTAQDSNITTQHFAEVASSSNSASSDIVTSTVLSMTSVVAEINTSSTTALDSNVTTQYLAEVVSSSKSPSSEIVAFTTPTQFNDSQIDITSTALLDANATTQYLTLVTSRDSSSVSSTLGYISSAVHLSFAGVVCAVCIILSMLVTR